MFGHHHRILHEQLPHINMFSSLYGQQMVNVYFCMNVLPNMHETKCQGARDLRVSKVQLCTTLAGRKHGDKTKETHRNL